MKICNIWKHDFSTLYTALPHPQIIRNFAKIFQKDYSRENFINMNMQRAYLSSTAGKNKLSNYYKIW